MARPITLFTGQWADLPLSVLARKAASWGYDGLELACWGDHLDVFKGATDKKYIRKQLDITRQEQAEAVRDQQPSRRTAGVRPQQRQPLGRLRAEGGRRRPGEETGLGHRGHEEHGTHGTKSRREGRERIHRLFHLAHDLQLSARDRQDDRGRLRALREALESDPGCLRRMRCPFRPGGTSDGDRVRLSLRPDGPSMPSAAGRPSASISIRAISSGR